MPFFRGSHRIGTILLLNHETNGAANVDFQTINTDAGLRDYCRQLACRESIAFDTEFVSEHTFRPKLCLVQVSAGGRLAVIDPLGIDQLRPFWEVLADGDHEIIVHAGRGELEFCLQAIDRLPGRLFDVQVAAGLVGIEYPAGYGTLISRILGQSSEKHETRTDWRRRPLSQRQIEYAVEDVLHLPAIRDRLHNRLAELGRLEWLGEEMAALGGEIRRAQGSERWRRISGSAGLDSRGLAVVRELWKWREAEAQRRDQPARRVLRDDLIIELARRQTPDPKRIQALRGMERGDLARRVDQLAACIQQALALPERQCPPRGAREPKSQLSVLGQFLFAALSSLCRQSHIAPGLVGGPNDIRDWIACRATAGRPASHPPRLALGWRAEFVGRLLEDLLAGKLSVRVGDPASDHPLLLEELGEA
jgi:ribonuclease D